LWHVSWPSKQTISNANIVGLGNFMVSIIKGFTPLNNPCFNDY